MAARNREKTMGVARTVWAMIMAEGEYSKLKKPKGPLRERNR
jgi:hypothetical protein